MKTDDIIEHKTALIHVLTLADIEVIKVDYRENINNFSVETNDFFLTNLQINKLLNLKGFILNSLLIENNKFRLLLKVQE